MHAKLKTLLIVVIVLLIAGVVVMGTILFLISKNEMISNENQKLVYQEEERTNQAKKVVSLLERTKEAKDLLMSNLLPDSDIVRAIDTIEKTATRAGVSVEMSALTADDSTSLPVGTINKVKTRIDAKGTWNNLLVFTTLLESLPYKINIASVNIRQNKDNEKAAMPVWNMAIQIEILKIK